MNIISSLTFYPFQSWDSGNDRLREKLLSFIGKIGQDSRLGQTAVKMLDALWELARVPALPPKLVHQAMNEHLTILNESATRDQVKERKFRNIVKVCSGD